MGRKIVQPGSGVWRLAESQHGVVTRGQLLELGYSSDAIQHRISKGRLHPLWSGVYTLGRPDVTRYGRWMAAVLSCGPTAVLSHVSAAALWAMFPSAGEAIHVSVPAHVKRQRPGIVVHRRPRLAISDVDRYRQIPVTTPIRTLVDLATVLSRHQLEAAISETDKRDLVDVETLRGALDDMAGQPGVAALRKTLDRHTFRLTESELERRFLPLARRAGLATPETGRRVNGFRVDFYWPELGLVVETDGLRYHRTPAQQVRDHRRDQAHIVAGLTSLRFTHSQIRFEEKQVEATLRSVARRLRPPREP
jgi:very-short-patch-repair endonuclease